MIRENIEFIRQKIERSAAKSQRRASDVRLMAVTKFHPLSDICTAAPFVDLIGENKVQEATAKRQDESAPAGIPWHMIGHMQRNKIKKAAEVFDLIESIDNVEAASVLQGVLAKAGRTFPVFIEVNVTGEESKSGVSSEGSEALLCHILEHCPLVQPCGVMTMAREEATEAELHATFAAARELRDKLQQATGVTLPDLSMGMSGDFEIAIEEGSTIVRIGSSIFGARAY